MALSPRRWGAITGSIIVIAKCSVIDRPTALIARATVLVLWRVKNRREPLIVVAAALMGLSPYPLVHLHAR